MTNYSNGEKVRGKPLGHYITVYLTHEQFEFLRSECEKLHMKGSEYMRDLLRQVMKEAEEYLKEGTQ